MTNNVMTPEPPAPSHPGEIASNSPESNLGGKSPRTSLTGRWRFALRYSAAQIRRAKGRTTLIVVMVMLPVLAGTFLALILAGAEPTWQITLDTRLGATATAQVQSAAIGPLMQAPDGEYIGNHEVDETTLAQSFAATSTTITEYEQNMLKTLPTGSKLHREVPLRQLASSESGSATIAVVQTDLSDPVLADKFRLSAGVAPIGPEQIALSPKTAQDLDVWLGDTITLSDTDAQVARGDGRGTSSTAANYPTVTGILAPVAGTRASFAAEAVLPADTVIPADELFSRWHEAAAQGDVTMMSYDLTAPTWLISGQPVSATDVAALNSNGVIAVSRAVDPSMATPEARGAFEWREQNKRAENAWLALVLLIGLLQATLMAGPAFAVGAKRSERDLKIMATQGADRAALTTATLGHGVTLGVIGSVAGIVLGFGAVLAMWQLQPRLIVSLQPPLLQLVLILLAGVAIATVAAWLPARGAAKHYSSGVDEPFNRDKYAIGRLPWFGLTMAAVAAVGAIVAAGISSRNLLLVSIVALEVGLIMATGLLLQLFAAASKSLPLSWRYAARDAVRHRSRTVPATAAIIASVAGLTGALIYNSSDAQFRSENFVPSLASQVLAISAYEEAGPLTSTDIDAIATAVRELAPDASDPVPVAVTTIGDDTIMEWWQIPPDNEYVETVTYSSQQHYPYWDWALDGVVAAGAIVDDGKVAELLALPNPEDIRSVLAQGRAAVPATFARGDGTAQFQIWERPRIESEDFSDDGGADTDVEYTLPATGVEGQWPDRTNVIIPPSLAAEHGLETQIRSVLIDLNGPLPSASKLNLLATSVELEGASAEQRQSGVVIMTGGEVPNDDYANQFGWIVVLIAVLLTLAATGIVTVLAVTESRRDMSIMSAVGAAPRTRKLIATTQATFTAVSGLLLGLVGGAVLGVVLVAMERARGTDWPVVVPWLNLAVIVVVVPVVAAGLAALLTRARMPQVQRAE
ncbi:putative ABC transport system permease protein [Micrococcales bacterium KH10]|nr:putative ABC transport system permease protein [Micrococcales bacterium KH10]